MNFYIILFVVMVLFISYFNFQSVFGKIEEAPQIIVYRIIACFVFLPKQQYRLSVIGCVQKSFIGYRLSFEVKAITDNRYDNLEKKKSHSNFF